MNSCKLTVNRLIVFKSKLRAYDQKFHSGLNIIHGSNGSGKSTVLDFIFYALGGEIQAWKEVASTCDSVMAEVLLSEKVMTLKREVSKEKARPLSIYFGPVEDALEAGEEKWQAYPYARTNYGASFSQVLFKALGLPEIAGSEGANITMHQILRLMYVDQTTPFQRIYRSERFDSRDTREAISELLFGIGNSNIYSLRLRVRALKKSEIDVGNKLMNLLRATDPLRENFKSGAFEREVDNLNIERAKIVSKVQKIQNIDISSSEIAKSSEVKRRDLHGQVAKMRSEISKNEDKIFALEFEINDSNKFITHLRRLLTDFDNTSAVYQGIGYIPFELCPACLQPLHEEEMGHCILCKEVYELDHKETRILELRMDLEGQISESQRLQADRVQELAEVKSASSKLKKQMNLLLKRLDHYETAPVDGRTALVSELSQRVGAIDARLISITSLMDIRSSIDSLRIEKEKISNELTGLQQKIDELEVMREKRRNIVRNAIVSQTKSILLKDLEEHNDFETLDDFSFSFEDDWFAVNGDPNISASASGMVVVKNSLFLGMLRAAINDKKIPYPKFLLLDNVEDKGMVGERVRNFQKAITEIMKGDEEKYQIIMTTSTLNPDLENKNYVIGPRYNKKNKTLNINFARKIN